MKRLNFYKETEGRWYVDLPEWNGDKSDLEMVSGADAMLEYMAEGSNQIFVNMSESFFENSDEIIFKKMADDIGNGAYYYMDKYRGINIELDLWLCDVTKFVFGSFPNIIFISKTN